MIEFFNLDESNVFGKNRLNAFKYGYLNGEITDYANDRKVNYIENENVKTGSWWLNSKDKKILGSIYNPENNDKLSVRLSLEGYGIRPAVKYDDIKQYVTNIKNINGDVMEVTLGSYPQSYTKDEYQVVLDTLFNLGELNEVDKGIYQYNDDLVTKANYNTKWVIYEPIVWVVDKKSGIAFSKNILDGGEMDYAKVESFLQYDFALKALPYENIVSINKIRRYNELKRQKDLLEAELNELEKEIFVLKREK